MPQDPHVRHGAQRPVDNMARLKRAGVDLSDALKTQIEGTLIANGNLVGAQKLLIDQLSKSYNGAAIARDTLGGALVALKENFANLFWSKRGREATAHLHRVGK